MSMKQQYDQCVAWIIPYTLQQNGFLAKFFGSCRLLRYVIADILV